MRVFVVVAAAGSGTRAELGYNKLLYRYGEKTVLEHTLTVLSSLSAHRTIVTTNQTDLAEFERLCLPYKAEVCKGGNSRGESVALALSMLAPVASEGDVVVIHDAARPLVPPSVLLTCVKSAARYGSGVASVGCSDTVVSRSGARLNREDILLVQTPQAFRLLDIIAAYAVDGVLEQGFTDDASVYENCFGAVRYCEGSSLNRKLTTNEDFETLALPRIGNGYDIHEVGDNYRPLLLCGVIVPNSAGLIGHSDADVCVHALMDALLSSAGERDIGVHFPSTPEFFEADSFDLLSRVLKLISPLKPVNVTLAIIAEKPRLSPYIPDMKKQLARALSLDVGRVGITVTTAEGLGLVGSQKAIACYATCLVR